MTFGRLFGGLGGHLDDLRVSLEKGGILGAKPFHSSPISILQTCILGTSRCDFAVEAVTIFSQGWLRDAKLRAQRCILGHRGPASVRKQLPPSGIKTSESPRGSLTRIEYQLGYYSTRSTRINSYFGIVSDDLDGTNRGLSGHSFQRYLATDTPNPSSKII